LIDLTASYNSIEDGRRSELDPVKPFTTVSDK
jgi:hypothetical protein